jgi:glycosyltransferase involved in cell wall biosynthesis
MGAAIGIPRDKYKKMAKHPINIGIDARLYGLEHAGLGRYCMNLVDRLIHNNNIHWTLFLNKKYEKQFSHYANVTVVNANIKHYSLAEQIEFLNILNNQPINLLHIPHFNVPIFYNRPFVVTIHDILWHQVRGGRVTTLSPLKYYLKYAGYRLTVNHAISKALRIYVPSNYVKIDLLNTFNNLDSKKIIVTYEGVDPRLSSDQSNKQSNNIVYIGSAYPHKNLHILLQALTKMDDVSLTIVGSRSVFLDHIKREVRSLNIEDRVIFAGYQTDEEVKLLLSHAICLVHPSKSEGFGLTGLEAMATGTPVIASNATALPEIYQDAALYFDPDDSDGLVTRIRELITNSVLRASLITKGRARAMQFSWDKMVDDTIAGYRDSL